jgi:hypothetical protein
MHVFVTSIMTFPHVSHSYQEHLGTFFVMEIPTCSILVSMLFLLFVDSLPHYPQGLQILNHSCAVPLDCGGEMDRLVYGEQGVLIGTCMFYVIDMICYVRCY